MGGGAGVGAEGGASLSPTQRKVSGSSHFTPAMKPVRAVLCRLANTWGVFQVGFCSSSNAAPPDTCGQAMEVPLKDTEALSELAEAEMMLLPGAIMLLQRPQLLYDARSSREVVAPTVMAVSTNAGEKTQELPSLFPAATTTTTPASVAIPIVVV